MVAAVCRAARRTGADDVVAANPITFASPFSAHVCPLSVFEA